MASLAIVVGPVVGGVGASPLQSNCDSSSSPLFNRGMKMTANTFRKSFNASKLLTSVRLPSKTKISVSTERPAEGVSTFPDSASTEVERALRDLTFRKQASIVEIQNLVQEIREMFRSMKGGEITVSPYDTAWVALIPAMDGSPRPEFPKSVEWILNNQLEDGSWGIKVANYSSYYDRVINSLACVVALQTWQADSSAITRGLKFIRQNLQLLGLEPDAHMTPGFEVSFPAMMKEAKKLGIDLPYDSPAVMLIENERQRKLARIPMDIVHEFPTTILYSLEAFRDEVDWNRMIKLQCEDGSFLTSPCSTAACVLHTRDEKALGYLRGLLAQFNNGVPHCYPFELLEHLWMVDRIQRLGIDRYFKREIRDCLERVYKDYKDTGISWTKGAPVQDLDDTAMCFRLLRQHGYDVSESKTGKPSTIRLNSKKEGLPLSDQVGCEFPHADMFKQFKTKDGGFVCFAGESSTSVSVMFNFYRATQTRFPQNTLLADAEPYARSFLAAKASANDFYDKWVIPKDLGGEVRYALGTPWFSSLPLVESSTYLEQYGVDDSWMGKSLFKMPFVHNETFLALAKADYNVCQSVRRRELPDLLRWYQECRFDTLTDAREILYKCFFAAVLLFPAPELNRTRAAVTKASVILYVIANFFYSGVDVHELQNFVKATAEWDPTLMSGASEEGEIAFNGFYKSALEMIRVASIVESEDIGALIRENWTKFVESIAAEAEWASNPPSMLEYLEKNVALEATKVLLSCGLAFSGEPIWNELTGDTAYLRMVSLASNVRTLIMDIFDYKNHSSLKKPNAVTILMQETLGWSEEEAISKINTMAREYMRELVEIVLVPSHVPRSIKQAHFDLARISFLFYGNTDHPVESKTATKDLMQRILFEPVL